MYHKFNFSITNEDLKQNFLYCEVPNLNSMKKEIIRIKFLTLENLIKKNSTMYSQRLRIPPKNLL